MEGLLRILRGMMIYLDGDTGGAGGGTGSEGSEEGADGEATDKGGEGAGDKDAAGGDKGPTYLSQAPKEFAEKYKDYFKDYPKLTDALMAHVKATDSLKRAIVVPDKEKATAEEIQAFYKKMGIPENEAGYEMKADEKIPEMSEVAKIISKKALEAGLTKAQGKAMWETVAAIVGTGTAAKGENLVNAEKELPNKLTEAFKGEKDKASEAMNLFKAFTVRLGNKDLAKTMHDAGLLYNPAFVMRMAQIEKEIGDDTFLDRVTRRQHEGKPKGQMGSYHPDFDAFAGDTK